MGLSILSVFFPKFCIRMVLSFCGDDSKSQEKLKRTLMQICGEKTKSIMFLNKAYVQSFKYSDTCPLTFFMSFDV